MLKLMSKHLREANSIKQDETIYMYIIRNTLYVDHVQENNAVVVVTPLGTRYIGLKERRNMCTCMKFIFTFTSCSERCFVVFLQHHSISFIKSFHNVWNRFKNMTNMYYSALQ